LGSGNCAIPALTSDSFDALKRRYGAIVDAYPLVAAQRGIYVRCLFAPGTAVYIEQTSLDLDGDIDTAALAAAWQSIIDHHPALRTAFFRLPGIREPLQVVLEHVDAAFSHEDWRHLEAAAAAAHWTERLSDDRRRPFRPAAPPLCRLCLVRLGDTRWRLLLSYSHLVMDGWSEPIVLRELFDKHRRFRAGAAIIDPPSPTYRHFVTWLLRQDLRAAEEHWRRKLAGYTTPTRLAAEKAHAVHGATALEEQFGAVSIRLDAARCQALRAFARDYQITFNSVLQAAFGLCLGVASGTNDVMFGSVVSGRNAPIEGIGAMVGMAANTLPVRLQIEPERPIGAWLQNFQTELFEMLAYDWSPLSWVQRWSDVPAENLPLLRSLFVLANYPNATTIHSNAPTVTAIDLSTTPDFPLSLFVVPNDDLFVRAAYSKDVFEAPDVSAFLGVYARVLDAFVAMPAASVGALLDTIASEHRNTAPLAAPGMDGPI
jgi:hypothetical protein